MKHLLVSREEIKQITKHIGECLTKDLENESTIPVVIGIMKGSMNFMMDIIENINLDVYLDYIQVSSYNGGTQTTGKVTLKRDLSFNIKNRTIVLVEDVIDTGISMNFLLHFLNEKYHPNKIILVALLDKRSRRQVDVKVDYAGKVINEDYFVYGYGLDYNELGRNLPEIYALTDEEIKELSEKSGRKILEYVEALNPPKKDEN